MEVEAANRMPRTPPAQDVAQGNSRLMRLEVTQLRAYDRNPRQCPNSEYERIKASIRAQGLDQPLVVTCRPGETGYMLLAGGNTRLRAMSLRLQRAFGLRREEAIKFMPSYADKGDHLLLKRSWTKGGRPRVIPIRTDSQRSVLQDAHRLAGKGSLIPGIKNYVQQLHTYERLTSRAGLSKLHGLRHAYAQARYQELTGWPSPNAGGPSRSTLTTEQRDTDERSRLTVSEELGHSRLEITRVYLG